METDQKTPGQVLYEAQWVGYPFPWGALHAHDKERYEATAAAVLAHDRANQPAASGVWIPVSERLPEIDVPVLVVWNGLLSVMARDDCGDGWLWALQADYSSLASFDGLMIEDDYQPTHWQPLPAAPEAPKP